MKGKTMYPNYHEILILFLLTGVAGGYTVAKIIDWLWSRRPGEPKENHYVQRRDKP
jgi:hypothetical protein